MKKLIFSVMSVALVAGTMTSCGKSSVGKMSNDWKVTSYSDKTSTTQGNGDVNSDSEVGTATTYTKTSSSTSGGTTMSDVTDGTINENTMTIEKDGTWKSVKTTTTTSTSSPFTGVTTTSTDVVTINTSGTWSFVGKNKTDEFKTNERVVFNTLAGSWTDNGTSVTTAGGSTTTTTSTDSGSDNYKVGENAKIWTITESTAKSLKLSSETGGSYSHTQSGGGTSVTNTSSDSGSSEMVLEQK